MAIVQTVICALVFACATAQKPVYGFFNVPATAFHRGGRVDFTGLSLGQVCKQMMMLGGKEALSDGMGMAAKWFSTQRINSKMAGGADPQMQCLYSQATGSMYPGGVGTIDPGNMFADYFDTVIEYSIVMDPCTAPQCNGKVNPTVLLMQHFAPMMRMGGYGGMGGGMGGMGGGMGGMGGGMGGMGGGMGGMGGGMGGGMPGFNNPLSMAQNPLLSALMSHQNTVPATPGLTLNVAQNPLLSALMSHQNTVPATPGLTLNATAQVVPAPADPALSNAAAAPTPAAAPAPLPQGNPMSSMLQNPQMMQMMQQLLKQMFMGNLGQGAASPNPAASSYPAFPFGNFHG